MSNSTDLVRVDRDSSETPKRRFLGAAKKLGIVAVAAGLVGGVTLPAVAMSNDAQSSQLPSMYSSKWAVRGMTQVAAHDLAKAGIRVNGISPGVVDTPMIHGGKKVLDMLAERVPSGRVAEAHEIASIALFLASDASSYISGVTITADAALTA